jgi:hypothetical protein
MAEPSNQKLDVLFTEKRKQLNNKNKAQELVRKGKPHIIEYSDPFFTKSHFLTAF